MIPTSLDKLLTQRNTLMLQGPMGPFFARLAQTLRSHGQSVFKVNFNGGDDHYYGDDHTTHFRAPLEQWPAEFRRLVHAHHIDAVVLFGQSRRMHELAITEARSLGLAVYVFEEGYVRPDYVTLELGGVNAESPIPRDPAFYRAIEPPLLPAPQPTHQRFREVAGYAMTYSVARALRHSQYPHYRHHRSIAPVRQGLKWVRGAFRKWWYGWLERDLLEVLSAPEQHKRWFLAPLQVYNDSQIRRHSPFKDLTCFIDAVMTSFAQHASKDEALVFKHHPLDRPYNDYTQLIARRATELGIRERVLYVHDLHLPTLLKHARGVVTVNSTTGLQSLYHGTPVITLGECMYAIEGLVHPGPLDSFWKDPGPVDPDLFQRFRAYLIHETQINASFYGQAPGLPSSEETRRRRASSSLTPSLAAQSAIWSSPTRPTLK